MLCVKKAIIIVGMPGSGKSLGVKVAKNLSIPLAVMGDVIREEVTRRKLPQSPESLGKIMMDLRKDFGPAVVAQRMLRKLKSLKGPNVVIDGARSEFEIAVFRQAIDAVTVVAVHASLNLRFQRLVQRRRADDALTWEVFSKRDARELDIGLGRVIAQADVMLVNEGEPEELKNQILQIFKDYFSIQ